jgi:PAS domain S-box-containing protein
MVIGISDLKGCKQEGKELLEIEKSQYNSLFENMQEGFFIADIITDDAGEPVDYRFLEANRALENQTGIPLGKLIGKTALELHPGLDQFWIQTYGSVALTGKPVRFDHYSIIQKRYYEISAHQIRHGRFAAFFFDINERKLTENALRASEEKYRSLYEDSLDGILLAKPDGTILSANSQACSLFGMTEDEIIQADQDSLVVKNEKLSAMLKERELTGRAKAELTFRRKNGSTFIGETSSTFFTDSDGTLNTSMMIRDITERKQAEDAIRDGEQRFRLALRNAPISVAAQDRDLRYIWAYNQRTAKPEEVIGHFDDEIFTPEEAAHITPIKTRVLNEGIELREQMWLNRPSGRIFLDICWEPIRDASNQVIGVASATVDLTPIKLTEEALRLSEQKFAMAFANNPAAMSLTRLEDGVFLDVNDTWTALLGYSRDEVIGHSDRTTDRTMHIWPTADSVIRFVQELRDKGYIRGWEQEICNKAGKLLMVQLSAQVLTVQGEKVVLSTFVDITKRKLVEEELHKSKMELARAQQISQIGSWTWDVVTNEITWSEQSYRNYGLEPGEVKPSYDLFLSFIVPEDRERVDKELQKAVETGCKYNVTYNIIRRDGIPRILLSENEIIFDESGKIVLMYGTNQDITDHKKAEKELKEALETLHYSEDQFRALVQNVKSGIALIDETGKFAVVNPTFMQMFGLNDGLDILNVNSQDWSQWEVYGEDLKLLHVDDHPVRKVMITGKPIKSQLVAVKNPGANELTWMLINAEPILKENGQIYRVFCTYQDITERKRVEEALKKAHDTLEEKVKERTEELEKAYNSLKESEKSLAEAQKMAHLGNWYRSFITDKIYWSDEAYRIFGFEPQEFEVSFSAFLNCIHPEDRDYVKNSIEKALNEDPYEIDFRIISAGRKEHIVHSRGEVVFNKNGDIIGMRGTVQDITERKQMEKTLELLARLPQENPNPVIRLSQDLVINYSNPAAQVLLTDWGSAFGKEAPTTITKLANAALRDGARRKIEHKYADRTYLINLVPFSQDGYVNIYANDLTERKEAEEALKKIDKMRIKEIHHRIKNNLQVISSLLSLEAEKFSDKKVLTAFQESQNRVASMALIHEELYKSKGANNLNFAAYLQKLTTQLLNSYNLKNDDIRLNLNAEQVYLDMDTAIPLGIIINELVSNSLKHAFPDKKGEISLNLQKIEDYGRDSKRDLENLDITDKSKGIKEAEDFCYTLIVSDNGIGIPKDFDFENPDTLGLQLVNILVEQLDANIELKKDKGTEFIIKFSASGNSSEEAHL